MTKYKLFLFRFPEKKWKQHNKEKLLSKIVLPYKQKSPYNVRAFTIFFTF